MKGAITYFLLSYVAMVIAGDALSIFDSACPFKHMTIVGYFNVVISEKNCTTARPYNAISFQQQPTFYYYEKDTKDETYSLFFLDADSPTATGKGEYFLNIFVANLKGQDLARGDISKGTVIGAYFSTVPIDLKLDRYMAVVYKHKDPNARIAGPIITPLNAIKFNLTAFLETTPVKLIGPVGGVQVLLGLLVF